MKIRLLAGVVMAIALVVAACGGSSGSDTTQPAGEAGAGDPVAGATVYKGTCATCHGGDLQGIEGLGKGLAPNEFVASMSEEEVAAFLAVGRPASDPANMTGVDMPPKGGNPSLTEQDLRDVSAYLKAQQ